MPLAAGEILLETALLGQGLPSIADEEITASLSGRLSSHPSRLLWMHRGEVICGDLEQFLALRARPDLVRITGKNIERASREQATGVFTASAVMRLASPADIVVTAGMGGLSQNRASDDIWCLENIPVRLVASAPKDVFDLEASIEHLQNHQVTITSQSGCSDGFLLTRSAIMLDGPVVNTLPPTTTGRGTLHLNPLPKAIRCSDPTILEQAIKAGLRAERAGQEFHPAVNAALDHLTAGASSRGQLAALAANLRLAGLIMELKRKEGGQS